MKTYEEMIQFTVDQMRDRLRYNAWCAYILIAEAYGKTQEDVAKDINAEVSWREHQCRNQKKVEQRASNEARRLANQAKKEQSAMNEQILKFAQQAGLTLSVDQQVAFQRAAELIVKECYALVDYENKQFIKAQFKEHFGVEE